VLAGRETAGRFVGRGTGPVRRHSSGTVPRHDTRAVRTHGSGTVRGRSAGTVRAHGAGTVHARGTGTVLTNRAGTVLSRGTHTVLAGRTRTVRARTRTRTRTIVARANRTAVARANRTIVTRASHAVLARGTRTVLARASHAVLAHGTCTVLARAIPTVRARGARTVRARGAPTVRARATRGSRVVRTFSTGVLARNRIGAGPSGTGIGVRHGSGAAPWTAGGRSARGAVTVRSTRAVTGPGVRPGVRGPLGAGPIPRPVLAGRAGRARGTLRARRAVRPGALVGRVLLGHASTVRHVACTARHRAVTPPGYGLSGSATYRPGSAIDSSAPPSGALPARTSPPCRAAACATIESPSPDPGIVREVSAR